MDIPPTIRDSYGSKQCRVNFGGEIAWKS